MYLDKTARMFQVTVRYATRDGTAKAASDYKQTEGTLTFPPGERSAWVKVPIIDDEEIEDDEEFYVALSEPVVGPCAKGAAVAARLAGPKLHAEATVLIKDDDALPGTIGWRESALRVVESERYVTLTVERRRGHNGEVTVKYDTKAREALEGIDYVGKHGEVTFAHGEMSKTITVEIVDDTAYEKDENFLVVLSEPSNGAIFRDDTDGGADEDICTVTIQSDGGVRSKIDHVMELLGADRQRNTMLWDQWREQLGEAVCVEEDSRKSPYAWGMHLLMLPWKLLFKTMPPPEMCGGWGLFFSALVGLLIQVVLIGDLAAQLGCEVGLSDAVTAVTVVALGTSLPDLFASMQAAREEPTADNSIGNVTGSNSVNVFLGLGLPWLMASVYWAGGPNDNWNTAYPNIAAQYYPESVFVVCAGSLAFSVTVFTAVALVTLTIILARRFCLSPAQELGGNVTIKYATAAFLVLLYCVYILFSIVRSEELVSSFSYYLSDFTASPDCPL